MNWRRGNSCGCRWNRGTLKLVSLDTDGKTLAAASLEADEVTLAAVRETMTNILFGPKMFSDVLREKKKYF